MPKILVAQDEEAVLRTVETHLCRAGYEVLKTTRGDDALALAIRRHPDVILLEVVLPGMNGLDVCRELRQKRIEIPIILLTRQTAETDRVVGLEIGADDYVTKPFSVRELLARVRVQLRRASMPPIDGLARYRFGDVEIDFRSLRATRRGRRVELTSKEFAILRLFIGWRGDVITRERLLQEVWGYERAPATRTVDTHMLNLRQKLERDAAEPEFILSVYGEGYRFVG